MPSLQDGPSICLSGHAKVPNTEHELAHRGTDPRVASAGNQSDNGPTGLAPLGEILDIAIDEVSKVKPHCADEVKRKTEEAFKDVDRSKYGRTTQQPPGKGSTERAALARGDSFTPVDNQTGRRGRKRKQ